MSRTQQDSGAANKGNLGFGPAYFSKCMWAGHMTPNDYFLRRKGIPGTLLDTAAFQNRIPARKYFYFDHESGFPRKEFLYRRLQREPLTANEKPSPLSGKCIWNY